MRQLMRPLIARLLRGLGLRLARTADRLDPQPIAVIRTEPTLSIYSGASGVYSGTWNAS